MPVAEHVRKVEAEVDVLKQLHHTNIVRYLVSIILWQAWLSQQGDMPEQYIFHFLFKLLLWGFQHNSAGHGEEIALT